MKTVSIKIFLVSALLFAAIFGWQNHSHAQTSEETLKATASFKSDESVAPDTAIEISLNRNLSAGEKIAVTIEQTDVSGLFRQTENHFIYNAKLMPLPIGNSNLTVFLIEPNGTWKEIARLPLSVKEAVKPDVENTISTPQTPIETKSENQTETTEAKIETVKTDENKTEETTTDQTTEKTTTEETKTEETTTEQEKKSKFRFLPSFTIGMKSQPFQSNFPADTRPSERATFNDWTFTGSIKNEAKFGNFSSESNFDFAGATFKPETLQFGTLERKAPDIDLSSYLMNFQIGKAKFSLGHTSFGNNRHLVSSFSSRGLSVNIPLNKRFDITAGILNGTSVLGIGNFFGVAKIRHQVQGATLGIEFFPKRQNAMRLEITGFNGYLQALNGVSEGRVVDAERSRGFGLRFVTSDKTERLKLEYGYTLSRFFNPQDTTLDPDGNAVALPAVMRSAHYAEASYQLLKDLKLTKTKNLNLNFAFKYEYVEPLFRSLGASASADKFTHDYAIDGSIGEITLAFGHSRANDNLRNVPSILKSLTRSNRFNIALPLSALIGKSDKPSPFLPRLGYSIDRTHQFGAGIPVNGGFEIDLTTIPDLVNTNQTFNASWQFGKVNLDYNYNRSFADNRQTGSETNDQIGWVHGVTVGVNPLQTLGFNVGLNFENSRNLELSQVNRSKTLTLGINWSPFKGAAFTSDFSQNLAGDAARTNNNRSINYSAQFAYNFSFEKSTFRKFGMQLFMRFADTFARNRDFVADLNNRTRTKLITAGMTFNVF